MSQVRMIGFVCILALATAIASSEQSNDSAKSFVKQISGNVQELEWCGTNEIFSDETDRVKVEEEIDDTFDTRLFLLTADGHAYKSNSYGKQWSHLNNKFTNKNEAEPFYATEISISPVDGKTVYVWGNLTTSYMSDLCGKTWKQITHPTGLYDFRFHRKNKNWVLAHQMNKCSDLDDDCSPNQKILYYSKDGGESFTKAFNSVLEATWNRMSNFQDQQNPGIIAAIEDENGPRVIYTENYGETTHIMMEGADNFFQADYFLFLTVKPKTNEKNYKLMIATLFDDFNFFIDPKLIKLPFESQDHLSFTILKSEGQKVFISIHHQTDGFQQSNVYQSDWRGYELSLSLLYNVRSDNGDCDFEKIDSNEGVFIANTFDNSKVEQLRTQQKKNEITTSKNKSQNVKMRLNEELSQFKKTVISYDGGSNWHQLKAPSKRFNGKPYTCSGDCSLNLVGRTSNIGQIVASQNAPGMIMSIGNVGTHLTEKLTELNTYLSNDGGHTWSEVLKGPHTFEIGDHGGILIAAKYEEKTNIIKYSWDEGKTWGEHEISTDPFVIQSISTEPNNMDQRFIIYGRRNKSGEEPTTVLVHLDLQDLHTRACVGSEHPNRPNSDYEEWIPTNFKGDQCLLGRKVKYIRRKKQFVEQCPCSEDDWECDFGFYRKDNQGECIPMNAHFSKENLEKPPADCSWNYIVSKGYRLIPGMFCDKGVNYAPEIRPCPPKIISARTEEDTEMFKSFKMQQEHILEVMKQKAEENKTPNDSNQQQIQQKTSVGNDSDYLMTFGLICMVASLLGAAVYFRESIRHFISGIGEIGSRPTNQITKYQSIQNPKNKSNFQSPQEKAFNNVRIQDEEKNYDIEDPDSQYIEEEKPVLQRDKEEYYEEYYD